MAVYTRPTLEQWNEIALRLGYERIVYQDEGRGTNDTKFKVTLFKAGRDPVEAMLNIVETKDVHVNGLPAEESQYLPMLLDHITKNSVLAGADGKKVEFAVPVPIPFDVEEGNMASHVIMDFKGVEKTVYIAPYIQGSCPEHHDNIAQSAHDSGRFGAAHAGWVRAASNFPEREQLKNAFPVEKWQEYAEKLRGTPPKVANPDAVKKLAARLKDVYMTVGVSEDHWDKEAEKQIVRLLAAVDYITANWDEKTSKLPKRVINGDPFPDNLIDSNGIPTIVDNGTASWYVNTDLAMGLNAATMKRIQTIEGDVKAGLDRSAASAYITAYDNALKDGPDAIGITDEEKAMLPFLGEAAAIRWALSRTLLIVNAPEGALVKTRPPNGPLDQYDFWRDIERRGIPVAEDLLKPPPFQDAASRRAVAEGRNGQALPSQ